jgi:LasA protease
MDMQSNLLAGEGHADLSKPFGTLSPETGFSNQVNDVLTRLTRTFYEVLERQELLFQAQGRVEIQQSAATQAMLQLLALRGSRYTDEPLTQLANKFEHHFKRSLLTKETLFTSAPPHTKTTQTTMQLPWPRGDRWYGGGAHGNDGSSRPYSSLDYAYDWPRWGGRVYYCNSAHSGNVSVFSSCNLRITHSTGWATQYYHMDNIAVRTGASVSRNARIAQYASSQRQALCDGGSSTGPHVHFSLLFNGRHVSLQGYRFSNYEVNIGSFSYDDDCRRFFYRNWNNGGAILCAWRSMTA